MKMGCVGCLLLLIGIIFFAAVAGGFDSMSLLSHRGWMVSRAMRA